MRAALLACLALLTAGCVNVPAGVDTATDAAAALPIPAAPDPFTMILCVGDVLEALDAREKDDCNFRVTTEHGPAAEVSIAVNPLDPMNLVGGAKDFTLGEDERCGKYSVWSGVYASKDGGRTWTNGWLPGYPGDERTTALSEYPCGSDPVLVFGPEGNVYYTSLMFDMTDAEPPLHPILAPVSGGTGKSAIAVTRSRDGGTTWDDPVVLVDRPEGGLDKQWIATDPASGQIYLSFIDTRESTFYVQRSDDQGLTWTEPIELVSSEEDLDGPSAVQFGQIGVGPAGVVHFVYWAAWFDQRASGAYHMESRDGGATWSEPHAIADYVPPIDLGVGHKYRIVGMPSLAVDQKSGALYVAIPSRVTTTGIAADPREPGDADMLVASSTDGSSWSVVRVSDDIVGPANDQWMPAIAVGPDGTAHLTWMDYRDDPAGQSAHVYYSFSKDGGASWSPNVRVSDVPFDGTGGYHQSGSGTIGDYMGLAVSSVAVHPFWADTRDGRNDVFAAILPA